MQLTSYIRSVPDFPKPGILFRDITPLLAAPRAFKEAVARLGDFVRSVQPHRLVAIESRGFLFAAPIAAELGIPLIPVRKPGKLPAAKHSIEYALEYGSGTLDIHSDAIHSGDKVALVDDLLATGGTAAGASALIKQCGGEVVLCAFLIELTELRGRETLGKVNVQSLIKY